MTPMSYDRLGVMYDDLIDDIHPPVTIGELTWDASEVLREMDPTAYRCGVLDLADAGGYEITD